MSIDWFDLPIIEIKLTHNKGYRWYTSSGISVKGTAVYGAEQLLSGKELADYFATVETAEAFEQKLLPLDGSFSVVIHKRKEVFAAVDRVRNFPLFYSITSGHLLLADDIHTFMSRQDLRINDRAALYMRAFGYTPGKETLIGNVSQLMAGEYIHYTRDAMAHRPLRFLSSLAEYSRGREAAKEEFRAVLKDLTQTLARQIGNRPVALPLSSGLDSRLIGWMLKEGGVKEVFCFTYGNRDSREVAGSKEIAERLGFEWLFIDYEPYIGEDYIHTPLFREYADYCGNGVSFPYIQEYFAARYLKEELQIPGDTVFLPGHSGDTLGGSHLFPDLEQFTSRIDLAEKIYRLKGKQVTLGRKERKQVIRQLAACINPSVSGFSHRAHDLWNIIERQAKQTVNSAKVWDFFGYEYLLPLWDAGFSDFLLSLPFEYRVYKNLYDEVLTELFAESNLLSEEAPVTPLQLKEQAYLRMRVKDFCPLLARLRRKKNPSSDFFYFRELLEPVLRELPGLRMNENNAALTEWYIRKVTTDLSAQPKESPSSNLT